MAAMFDGSPPGIDITPSHSSAWLNGSMPPWPVEPLRQDTDPAKPGMNVQGLGVQTAMPYW